MRRSLIALDCDGVLADFDGHCLKVINAELGTSYTKDDWTDWGGDWVGPMGKAIIEREIRSDCYGSLDPIPGAREQVQRLSELYDVVVVSSMHPKNYDARHLWLREHISDRIGLVPCSSELKAKVCRSIGAVALADDYQPTIVSCYHHGYVVDDPLGWLIDRRYNRSLAIPEEQGARRGTLEQFVDHMLAKAGVYQLHVGGQKVAEITFP